jgi:hypothetical protein
MDRRLGMSSSKIKHQQGAIVLALIVVVALTALIIVGMLMQGATKSQQGVSTSSTRAMLTMKQATLDFARQKKRLPTISEFKALTQTMESNIGRKAIYLVDDRFAQTNNVCNLANEGLLQVRDCGADTTCTTPGIVPNLVFVLIDGGQNVLSLADPVHQSSSRTTSTSITPATANQVVPLGIEIEFVHRYAAGSIVGRFGNVPDRLDPTLAPYDDTMDFASTASLRESAGCNLVTQGDVIGSGGDLRILNTSLPDATLNTHYTKLLVAYGIDAATYTFSITPGTLPAGISLIAMPGTKTAELSGTPTAVGMFPITVSVSTTAAGYSRTAVSHLTLNVVACPNWVNSGVPQTVACPTGHSGITTQQQQTDLCNTSPPRWIDVSNTCLCVSSWSDTGNTRPGTCPVGYSGSIVEKEQTDSCSAARQWVQGSNTCSQAPPVVPVSCRCRTLFGATTIDPAPPSQDVKCTNQCCTAAWPTVPISFPVCTGVFCQFMTSCS